MKKHEHHKEKMHHKKKKSAHHSLKHSKEDLNEAHKHMMKHGR